MARTLTALLGNHQRLDGGSMFGNAPRALWERWLPPDDRHRVPLACRCLLVEEGDRKLLFETGIGAFFEPKLADRYGIGGDGHVLLRSLAEVGVDEADIDVVVLSHLHFDHAGGLLSAYGNEPRLHFPNATYVVSEAAWERALKPHARDRASFIPVLHDLLRASGRLQIVADGNASVLGPGFRFHLSHGHTPGLLLTEIDIGGVPVVFGGDLVPGMPWVHVPITMGYDRFPELLIDEKEALFADLAQRGGHLFFAHDHAVAMAAIICTDKGRFVAENPRSTLLRATP